MWINTNNFDHPGLLLRRYMLLNFDWGISCKRSQMGENKIIKILDLTVQSAQKLYMSENPGIHVLYTSQHDTYITISQKLL
jgi:hypothetical protein